MSGRPREARRRRWRKLWRMAAAVVGLAVTSAGAWEVARAAAGDPVDALEDDWYLGHRVLDRDGRLLREIPNEHGRRGRPIRLPEVGPRLVIATLAAEDRHFREHDGVSRTDLARAGAQAIANGRVVSGASTVTQQLVKMLDHRGEGHERTLALKVDEAMRAQNLEERLGKDEILEAYLARLPYGHGLVGPRAAANGYFGVESAQLSWAQAAFLAVLPRAPSYLDPRTHLERATKRQRELLTSMHALGHIDADELERALAEPIELVPARQPFHAPHMVESLRQAGELEPGSSTRTTLDLDLQRDVEGIVRTHLATLADRAVGDAAVLVVDNRNGEVLAYVGSADFHDPDISGQVDMVRAPRQPGSTLKPFVYALAFEHGHYASEMLADVPRAFGEGRGEYRPHNFDHDFQGPVAARDALAGSLNVPAVGLAAELEEGELLARLQALGFTSLTASADHYGLALALGGGEVALRELAEAYVTLARGGDHLPLRLRVSEGAPVGERAGERVMPADVAASVTEILADPLARVRLIHGRSPFSLGFDVAVKTGTSSGYRDAWAVGFTHEFTVAVWLGNADGEAMDEVAGASGAGPLFADLMRRAMAQVRVRAPLWDRGALVDVEVCPLSGAPVGPACPTGVSRWIARDHLPQAACTAHVHAHRRASARTGTRYVCDARGDEVIAAFPPIFDEWLGSWAPGAPGKDPAGIPWLARTDLEGCAELDPLAARLAIEAPTDGEVFLLGAERGDRQWLDIHAELRGVPPGLRDEVAIVDFVLDGEVVASSPAPYRAQVPLRPGDHELRVRPRASDLALRGEVVRFSVR